MVTARGAEQVAAGDARGTVRVREARRLSGSVTPTLAVDCTQGVLQPKETLRDSVGGCGEIGMVWTALDSRRLLEQILAFTGKVKAGLHCDWTVRREDFLRDMPMRNTTHASSGTGHAML